jgi:hypothetical protein
VRDSAEYVDLLLEPADFDEQALGHVAGALSCTLGTYADCVPVIVRDLEFHRVGHGVSTYWAVDHSSLFAM